MSMPFVLPASYPLIGLGLVSAFVLTVSITMTCASLLHSTAQQFLCVVTSLSSVAKTATTALTIQGWQSSRVMAYRKSADVQYPTLYASDEAAAADPKKKQYNCAQRAHQNTLENLPMLLALTAYFGELPDLCKVTVKVAEKRGHVDIRRAVRLQIVRRDSG
jgi:hypothetical protein